MLEEYKERRNISYDQLQDMTNIDRQIIYRTIKGITTPRIDTFAKICISLNMTNEEIGKVVKNTVRRKKEKD